MSQVQPNPRAHTQRLTPWLRRVGRSNALAMVISLVAHGAIFAGFYQVIYREEPTARRDIVPEARLAPSAGPSSPQPAPPLRLSQQNLPSPPELKRLELKDVPLIAVDLDEPGVAAESLSRVVQDPKQLTSGSGSLLDFRTPGSAASGPPSSFFGVAGNAYKVVYVVDLSASLMAFMEDISREMLDSVRALVPTQQFHIVLAKPLRVEEFAPARLVPAIQRYKTDAASFIRSATRKVEKGAADPIEALRRAYAARPELIYFLSDGDYLKVQPALEAELKRLQAEYPAKITTIGFGLPEQPDAQGLTQGNRLLLEWIARYTGGHFRAVEPKPLAAERKR